MFASDNFVVIGGTGNHDLDTTILRRVNDIGHGGLKFLHLNMGQYPDGEPDDRIEEYGKIKGKHVLLFQSIHSDVPGLQRQFLTLAWAAKHQYGAKSITAIVPFLCYRRQDNKQKQGEIDRNRMFCYDMRQKGVTRLILCDIHSKVTLENCEEVGIKAYNVDPTLAYADKLRVLVNLVRNKGKRFYVYSPDEGSIERAALLARALNVPVAVDFKKRMDTGNIKGVKDPNSKKLDELSKKFKIKIVAADKRLRGSSIAVREDELATGDTAREAGKKLKEKLKINELYFCCTHPVCTPGWKRKFIDNSPYDGIFLGNTIPRQYNKATGGKTAKVDMSQVIANKLIQVMSDIENSKKSK